MSVTPIHYNLEFEPDLKKFTFSSKEEIDIFCKKPTKVITLDAAEIKIKQCHILYNKTRIDTKTALDSKAETLVITLDDTIKGNAVIQIEFQGILNDRLLGFYRSRYQYKGKTKYLATTQFEAADARRAFPCWDTPAVKATFDISIITTPPNVAISNMPVKSKQKIGKKIRYTFFKTPIVSTYLIYLGVGEFEFLTGKTGKITVRVVTTRGKKHLGKYSLDLGKKLITAYEKYFGIPYPLPKLDLIAVPDFAAGAMENWGAITFRETILLYDSKTSSTRTKQFIAEVISHELAHQWFGNLVTMEWWNDLWLNESFATYMATKFVDKFYPKWDLWNQFIEDAMNTAMTLDSLKSSHPIDVKVNKPSEIREIFDAISYDKGGCVLRMLEHYVGEKNFRNGLKRYLLNHKYSNATGADLWGEIGKASGLPVSLMVNSWIKQVGFPLVTVSQNNSKITLKQKRFLLESGTSKNQWHIPISVKHGKKYTKKLCTKKTDTIKINSRDVGVMVNSGRTGFYRTRYDKAMLLELKMLVDNKTLSSVDRWSIQNDLFALCISGDETVRNYLDFTDAYYDEREYLPAVNVAHNLYSLYTRTIHESFSCIIKPYTVNYFENLHKRLGWDARRSEDHTSALLRSFTITALGIMGNSDIISQANTRFKKHLSNKSPLPPDLRDCVYSLVGYSGDDKTLAKFISLYKKATIQEEKLRYLGAMYSFKDPKLLLLALDFSKTPHVRSQNMQLPIMKTASNIYGKKILWPWLKKNWTSLSGKVGHGNPLFNRIVSSLSLVADPSMELEIRKFFEKHPTPGTARTLEQTLEKTRINTRFLKRTRSEFS